MTKLRHHDKPINYYNLETMKKKLAGGLRTVTNYLFMFSPMIALVMFLEGNKTAIYIGVLILIVYIVVLVYKMRETIMMGVRQIETTLHGKPLDKMYWSKEEWENRPKKKFVWRKKK